MKKTKQQATRQPVAHSLHIHNLSILIRPDLLRFLPNLL